MSSNSRPIVILSDVYIVDAMSSTTPIVAPIPQISLIAPPLVTRAPTDSLFYTIPVSIESNSYVPMSQDDRGS